LRYRSQKLTIGYGCSLKRSHFGYSNHLSERVVLTDVELGDFSYIGARCHLSKVRIGKFCSIAPDVKAGLGMHPSRGFVSTHPALYAPSYGLVKTQAFEEYHPIAVGHDVWIGTGATLMDGIKIGNGAIVGAHAVVTKDVPPYAVAVGIPAKIIRYRFSPEEIAQLQAFAWWDKSRQWLREQASLMQDTEAFFKEWPPHKPASKAPQNH